VASGQLGIRSWERGRPARRIWHSVRCARDARSQAEKRTGLEARATPPLPTADCRLYFHGSVHESGDSRPRMKVAAIWERRLHEHVHEHVLIPDP